MRNLINLSWLFPIWRYCLILVISQVTFYGNSVAQKRTAIAPGRAFYVSDEGNNKNDGSSLHPWKTFIPVNSLHLRPGDSILLEGSHFFSGTILIDSSSGGNASRPVFISSYGKGFATIRAGDSSAIVFRKTSHLSIRNLHLEGSGRKGGNVNPGLEIVNARQIVVDRLDISGFQKAGLLIQSSSDITVLHLYAHQNGAAGIEVGGMNGQKNCHNLRIAYCLAEDNPGDPSNLTNHSGNGIVVGNCTKVIIEYCTATNNGWDMPRIGNGPVGIWAYEADQVTIQHCLSYRNKTSVGGADGGGFDLDGGVTNSVIQYCYSYENQGAGYCIFQYYYASSWHDNVFRYNISENDGAVSDAGAGMYVWNSSRDERLFFNCLVYNNTIYNAKAAALSYSELSKRTNFAFYNNIFIGKDSLVKGEKGVDLFQGNDWWSLSKLSKGMNSEKLSGSNIDPAFVHPGQSAFTSASSLKKIDKYRLVGNSQLRKSGIDLHTLSAVNPGSFDFNGQPVSPYGIGACF